MELAELEVGELRAGDVSEHGAGSDRPARIRGPAPERRPATRGQDRRGRPQRAGIGDHAGAAAVLDPERHRRGALEHVDPVAGGRQLGEPAGQRPTRLGPSRMNDPAGRMAPFQPEREATVRVEVEANPTAHQRLDGRGGLSCEHLDRGDVAEPAAGGQRVLGVSRGGVVGRHRGGEPALRPEAGALAQRFPRDHRDPPARLRRLERDVQTRRPATDDGHVAGGARRRGLAGQGRDTVSTADGPAAPPSLLARARHRRASGECDADPDDRGGPRRGRLAGRRRDRVPGGVQGDARSGSIIRSTWTESRRSASPAAA